LQAADARRPQQPQILYDWAMARKAAGEPAEALALLERAITLAPQVAELLHAKGLTLMELKRPGEAAEAYRAALQIAPDRADTHNNIGSALRELGFAGEAHEHYERAIRAMPNNPQVLLNLAASFSERGDFQQALAAYDQLLGLHPGHPDVLYYKAQTLLAHGNLAEGWRLFAARLHCAQDEKIQDRLLHPMWSGQSLRDRHVLIWTEQGLGDEIMLASMVPDVLAEARKVTLLCSKRLVPLFQRSFPKIVVAERATTLPDAAFASDIDFKMSMSELGLRFRNDLARFPRRKTFLTSNASLRQILRRRYEALAAGRKIVGISWRSSNPFGGPLKSTELERWLPLLTMPDVLVVDLQYGDTAEERRQLERVHGATLTHDGEIDPMQDIDAMAAQIAAMDEVVSISNTTVHMAGALGVPTTMLLPLNRGRRWYWFRGRDRTAWYPSVAIRDFPDAEWDGVLAAVAAALGG
jgi:Tfp pilus assembly protein PilF